MQFQVHIRITLDMFYELLPSMGHPSWQLPVPREPVNEMRHVFPLTQNGYRCGCGYGYG